MTPTVQFLATLSDDWLTCRLVLVISYPPISGMRLPLGVALHCIVTICDFNQHFYCIVVSYNMSLLTTPWSACYKLISGMKTTEQNKPIVSEAISYFLLDLHQLSLSDHEYWCYTGLSWRNVWLQILTGSLGSMMKNNVNHLTAMLTSCPLNTSSQIPFLVP